VLQQIQIAAELGYQGIEARYPLTSERGTRELTQLHADTLTDTVQNTVRFFEKLEHPNWV